jgi:hypothetical protein
VLGRAARSAPRDGPETLAGFGSGRNLLEASPTHQFSGQAGQRECKPVMSYPVLGLPRQSLWSTVSAVDGADCGEADGVAVGMVPVGDVDELVTQPQAEPGCRSPP